MKKFTPIAMRCTQEQFEAIKPKLRGLEIESIDSFIDYRYLVNNFEGNEKRISNLPDYSKGNNNREIHEEWNEEIFLKACCIEVEPTLTEQLEKAEAEVKRLKEAIEDSKIKVGDWGKFWDGDKDVFIISKIKKFNYGYITLTSEHFLNCEKITNKELINKLNEL